MDYVLKTLWHERQRFLPGVLAVAFSALLIALQSGLLLGLFSITSIPIDHSRADIWVGGPNVVSVDVGRSIPESYLTRLAEQPEVESAEIFLQGFAYWMKPSDGSMELCMVVGSRLEDDSLGAMRELTPAMRGQLTEPGSIVIDDSELTRLGVGGVGETAEIAGRRVRIVGLVHGLRSLAGPFIFCSITTARTLLRLQPTQTTYVLGRCRDLPAAQAVVERLRGYPTMSAFTSEEFSLHSRLHWLTKTKAGIALSCAAALGLLVGAVVTSQTLYAATVASLREYAVLSALGIPQWRLVANVLIQSFWVGLAGIVLALPIIFGLAQVSRHLSVSMLLPGWLLAATIGITLAMALLSGVAALRSLRLVEPITLLR